MENEKRVESTVPVQGRVSIITLAELDKFWMEQGESIRTMSQLISWSMETFAEALKSNGMVEDIKTVAEAHDRLVKRKLYQKFTLDRSKKKIGTAIRFEEMRRKGINPKNEDIRGYNKLHSKQTMESPISIGRKRVPTQDEIEAAQIIADKRMKSGESLFRPTIEPVIVKDKMTKEELAAKQREIEERDRAESEALANLDLNELMEKARGE